MDLVFLLGYGFGVLEAHADPTATFITLFLANVVFFLLYEAIAFLWHSSSRGEE